MRFTKMHGAGNDFIIINNMDGNIAIDSLPQLARRLCARQTAIGADGMMVVTPAKDDADYAMLFYNADGSLGEMCGNGARCICRYGYEKALASHLPRVETTAGIVTGERLDSQSYRIRLNDPSLVDSHRRVKIDNEEYDCCYVELGTPGLPHAIVIMPGFAAIDTNQLRELGRKLRYAKEFPKGANVSFVDVKSGSLVDIITFERGVEDFTLACGTGCGSAALSLLRRGICGRKLELHAPGGTLHVELLGEDDAVSDIYLSGPTCIVCEGEVSEELLENL